MKRFKLTVAVALTALGITAAAVSPAHASTYHVVNSPYSDVGFNIYNHLGCAGSWQHLFPDQTAHKDHLWQTFWLPAHHKVTERDLYSPHAYTITNVTSHHECIRIDRSGFNPVGIRLWVRHN